jgi:translation initiation factor IF-2
MKRGVITSLVLLLGLAGGPALAAQKLETLEEMKARVPQVPVEERVRICAGIARRAVEEAKDRYAKGVDEEGKLLLHDAESYAEQAAEAAIHSRKHEKQLEIDLRDIGHHLEALKRELAPEEQPYAEAAVGHLEKLRTRLLESMFGKSKK